MNDARELAAAAEVRLLAGVMWNGYLPSGVSGDMFARESHRAVWDACQVSDPLNPPTVCEQLARDGKLDVVGGAGKFWESFGSATVLQHEVDRLADDVAEWAGRRHMFAVAGRLATAAGDLSQDPRTVLADLDELEMPSRSGLTVHTGDQIGLLPPPVWLVDGHMQDGLSVIFGPWASGKSFVAADVAVAVASGQPWWSNRVVQGPVLYLALEGASGLAQRLEAAARARGVGMDRLHLSGDPVNLGNRSDVANVDQAVKATGARLLVVDTWARATAGADENDNGSAGRAVEALDRIRQRRGCATLVLHHARKGDATDPRGAGSLPAAADSVWNVTKTDSGKIRVVSAKQKDGEDFRTLTFALRQLGRSATLEQVTQVKSHEQADMDRADALDLARSGPVLKALIRSRYGPETLDALCRHPDVREVVDDQNRPCVTAKNLPI